MLWQDLMVIYSTLDAAIKEFSLICEKLYEEHSALVQWVIVGRDRGKLERMFGSR
jgi:hypothetical protein